MYQLTKAIASLLAVTVLAAPSPANDANPIPHTANGVIEVLKNNSFGNSKPLNEASLFERLNSDHFSSTNANVAVSVHVGSDYEATPTFLGKQVGFSFKLPARGTSVWKQPSGTRMLPIFFSHFRYTVPVPHTDGSVSISNILLDQRAGNRIKILDTDSRLCNSKRQLTALLAKSNCFVLAPAWAMDSNGRILPSRYQEVGRKIFLKVDLSSPDIKYPIVTQALLGTQLIDREAWIANPPFGPTLEIFPSYFGRMMGYLSTYPLSPPQIGALDVVSAGIAWYEVIAKATSRQKTLANSETMHVQFLCHYFFVSKAKATKRSWNLDLARPARDLATAVRFQCNVPL